MIRKTDFRLKLSFLAVLAAGVLFTVARLALLVLNWDFLAFCPGRKFFPPF